MNSTNYYKITYVENNKLMAMKLNEKRHDFNHCLSVYNKLKKLSNIKDVKFVSSKDEIGEKTVSKILAGFELYVPLGELVDYEKELARLKSELEKAESEIARANGKLNNAGFVSKAPKSLIDGEKAKVAKFTDIKEKILAGIKELQN